MSLYKEIKRPIKIEDGKKWYEDLRKGKEVIVPLYPKEKVFHIELAEKVEVLALQAAARVTIIKPHRPNKGGQWSIRIATPQKAMYELCRKHGIGLR